jgi:CHAT domain-containing protein
LDENPEINSLIIVKEEEFNQIPFSVLITSNDNESTKWLFESVNLYYISHFEELNQRPKENYINNFYGFGDPEPKFGFPRLQESEKELVELGKGFSVLKNTNIFLGESSSIENLKDLNLTNSALAFSTHAIRPSDSNSIQEPALLLDTWLSSGDIAFNYKFNPALVILSACDTAWSSEKDRKPILDLPTAFRIGGAKLVLASNWKIQDKQTMQIMNQASEFIYSNRGIKNLISESLRYSKIKYIRENEGKFFSSNFGKISRSHPYFWGPFDIIGLPNS